MEPNFKDKLVDQQVADLANWMRAVWGDYESTFGPEGVASIRHGK
jgi:mono/diheme cytochrome c family protein